MWQPGASDSTSSEATSGPRSRTRDLHRAVALEVGQIVADEVEVVVDRVAAGGVGEVGVEALGAQFDDAAGLLVQADAELVVVQRRAGGRRLGFGRGLRLRSAMV